MNKIEAMKARHSVRQYMDKKMSPEIIETLQNEINLCNKKSGLHIQLVTNEPKAFSGFMAHYGKFTGVKNYIAMIGEKTSDLDEKCGYYGEHLVLLAQQMGLNTCWVKMTYSKIEGVFQIEKGEKLVIVIAIGYGKTQGVPHKSKKASSVADCTGDLPNWYQRGIKAALLAPTAVNQQKFKLSRKGNQVKVKAGFGPCSKIDLGIVKYHFELGAGKDHFEWV
ncbi:MAG: nitroreductase family protein [Lachnospiraceae bacterium]|nr:nitroreductase family protein [Lachnospiraceae bacterium]